MLTDAGAAYRLTRLVTADTLVDRPRDRIVRRSYLATRRHLFTPETLEGLDGEDGAWSAWAREDQHPPKLAELVTCPWCSGVWIGFGIVAARTVAPRAWRPVARALTLAAAGALGRGLER